jgi:putative hydrolase of the HAD superfamily
MEKPKAIFFDLDDTLMSFNGASEIAWKSCCENFVRINKVGFTSAEMLAAVEKTREWYWGDPIRHKIGRANLQSARREVFRYALNTIGFTDEEKVFEAAENYSRMQERNWKLFDGVSESLDMLKNSNIKMAVITNGMKDIQNGKLERFGIRNYFNLVITESEAGFSKPDAEIFQLALDKLSLSPRDVWMIGDNLVWDVMGSQKLGIFAVWNDYENRGLPADSDIEPDMIVGCVAEMAARIIS